jgi:predicted nucleic acid-binding protein
MSWHALRGNAAREPHYGKWRLRFPRLAFADAAVVECAERHGGRVMTLDGHFAIVAREGRIAVLPEQTAP